MARTESLMIPLGTKAPNFELLDTTSGNRISLEEMRGTHATLIAFICNHCPFVKHINPALIKIARDYKASGLSVIAISANDIVQYPEDGPEQMKKAAKDLGYLFPYLYDETQEVAKAYQAVCTPDFFVFDANLQLAYRGQLDDSRPGNGIDVSGKDIRESLVLILEGKPAVAYQKPSIGCNIKWKSNES